MSEFLYLSVVEIDEGLICTFEKGRIEIMDSGGKVKPQETTL